MATENKTAAPKLETRPSLNLHKKFKARCKKLGISMAERMRELIAADVKNG